MEKNKVKIMTNSFCERCFKPIKAKDDYFEILTYIKGKEVKRVYMHKKCNDEINNLNQGAMKMINNLGGLVRNTFNKLGVGPEQVDI